MPKVFKGKNIPSRFERPGDKGRVGSRERLTYGFAMCKKCHAFYYKKSWHHNTDKLAPAEAKKLNINFVLCPADVMAEQGLYEGELTISNVPKESEVELLNLIKNFGRRAELRDVLDRILAVKKQGSGYRVTTTENQLAGKLARKIKDVFKKIDLSFRYSKEPFEVERIQVRFLK
ncbi:MAG: hypothetical protein HY457_00630 [Parcubacteria group bacterium]|nr:hypothetical protein [Parcubacteria group bacterium]